MATNAAMSTKTSRRMLLAATSLGFGVVQLDVSVVNVAIHAIGTSLGGNVTLLQWIVSAYTLAFAALILSAGALGDRIGAKRIFIAGFAVFTLASVACGLAPSVAWLIGARVVQGIGAAILVPCSLALINHTYTEARERVRAIGLWAAGASVALAGGPLVGGLLIALWDWRAIFFINVPLGVVSIWLAAHYATETPHATKRSIDIPGQLAAITAFFALTWATIQAGSEGFVRPVVLAGYTLAILATCVFLALEHRQSQPMLQLSLFRSRIFSAMTVLGLIINVAFYGLLFVLSLFFQQAQHFSALQTGLAFIPIMGAVFAANIVAGRIARLVGVQRSLLVGLTLMGLGIVFLLLVQQDTAFSLMAPSFVLLGFGLGLIVPIMTSSLLASAEKAQSGVASGTLNTSRQMGSVIGVSVFGSFIAGGRFVSGLHGALTASVGLMLTGLLLVLITRGN
jgi:MFS transporter, DHA2 family, methylenomycin A resistance protein